MPAFSHCFLKRFMAFSNDSPSLTRTPGILGITTLRGIHGYPAFFESARVYARSEECQTLFGSAACGARLAEKTKSYAVPVSDFAGTATGSALLPARFTRSRSSLPVRNRMPRFGLTGITSPVLGLRPLYPW